MTAELPAASLVTAQEDAEAAAILRVFRKLAGVGEEAAGQSRAHDPLEHVHVVVDRGRLDEPGTSQ